MEWAQALEILTGPRQGDMLADNLRDVYPVSDLVDNLVRNQALAHSGPRLYTRVSDHPVSLVGHA